MMYGSLLPAGYCLKGLSIPSTMYVYNGNSILHKIKRKQAGTKFVRGYSTHQRSDLQSEFCRNYI